MLEIIIGQNASGKTLYLYNCIKEELDKNNTDFITNLNLLSAERAGFNEERIEILYDIIDTADEIITSNKILNIKADENFSKAFLEIMTLFCKDKSTLFLDEPEQGLSNRELYILANFLDKAEETYKRIVITTHSELLADTEYAKAYTVKMSDKTNELKLIEVPEEKILEVID